MWLCEHQGHFTNRLEGPAASQASKLDMVSQDDSLDIHLIVHKYKAFLELAIAQRMAQARFNKRSSSLSQYVRWTLRMSRRDERLPDAKPSESQVRISDSADQNDTHERRRIDDSQPNGPLHRQVCVERAPRTGAHRHRPNRMIDCVCVVADVCVKLCVGRCICKCAKLADDIVRPGRRSDKRSRCFDRRTHDREVNVCSEQVGVHERRIEGVCRCERDSAAYNMRQNHHQKQVDGGNYGLRELGETTFVTMERKRPSVGSETCLEAKLSLFVKEMSKTIFRGIILCTHTNYKLKVCRRRTSARILRIQVLEH